MSTLHTGAGHGVLRIDGRFDGPRHHANGGFACGTFAGLVDGPAKVRLHRMVPLDHDLDATRADGPRWVVQAGDSTLAEVWPHEPFLDQPPARPDLADARRAREAHPLRGVRHALSHCVVCGPERRDGLEVTPGPLPGAPDVLAAPFVVKPEYARDGAATTESVWGALDCTSFPAALMRSRRIAWLGELAVDVHRAPLVGEELVALGWSTGSGSRSHRTASALLGEDGEVVASGRAVWVEARRQLLLRIASRLR